MNSISKITLYGGPYMTSRDVLYWEKLRVTTIKHIDDDLVGFEYDVRLLEPCTIKFKPKKKACWVTVVAVSLPPVLTRLGKKAVLLNREAFPRKLMAGDTLTLMLPERIVSTY